MRMRMRYDGAKVEILRKSDAQGGQKGGEGGLQVPTDNGTITDCTSDQSDLLVEFWAVSPRVPE